MSELSINKTRILRGLPLNSFFKFLFFLHAIDVLAMETPSGSESPKSSSSTGTLLWSSDNNRTECNRPLALFRGGSGASDSSNQVGETGSTGSSSSLVPIPARVGSSNAVQAGPAMSNAEILEALNRLKHFRRLQKGYNFVIHAMTEFGSRMIQDALMLNTTQNRITQIAIKRVTVSLNGIPLILYLMINEHGSTVVSRIVEACNDQQLRLIVQMITGDRRLFLCVARNRYGSKLVKELIGVIKQLPLISMVVNCLARSFFDAMIDRRGSYVVLYCLSQLGNEQNSPLYAAAVRDCVPLATHKQGCISLNNFIEVARGAYRDQLLDLISENVVCLSQDLSGNYVVQKVLGLKISVFTVKMSTNLRGHYVNLSMQQSGSHVVESILKSPEGMENAVRDLINCDNLLQVTDNPFGNYVIQTALKVAKQADRELHLELLRKLETHFPHIQSGYGMNVYNLIVNGY